MENPINLTIIKTNNITSFEIRDMYVVLNHSARVTVYLKSGDTIVDSDNIKIEGDDYDKWLDDDQYIIDYVKNYITDKYRSKKNKP